MSLVWVRDELKHEGRTKLEEAPSPIPSWMNVDTSSSISAGEGPGGLAVDALAFPPPVASADRALASRGHHRAIGSPLFETGRFQARMLASAGGGFRWGSIRGQRSARPVHGLTALHRIGLRPSMAPARSRCPRMDPTAGPRRHDIEIKLRSSAGPAESSSVGVRSRAVARRPEPGTGRRPLGARAESRPWMAEPSAALERILTGSRAG